MCDNTCFKFLHIKGFTNMCDKSFANNYNFVVIISCWYFLNLSIKNIFNMTPRQKFSCITSMCLSYVYWLVIICKQIKNLPNIWCKNLWLCFTLWCDQLYKHTVCKLIKLITLLENTIIHNRPSVPTPSLYSIQCCQV